MRRPALLLILAVSAFAKRGLTPEDYFAFENISDPHLSPDGRQVAYVYSTVDRARNRRVTSIWTIGTDGQSAPRRLTVEGFNANSPRWSPDGSKLAFLSSRGTEEGAKPQIFVLPMAGGEAMQLTHNRNGASAIQWSPDGTRFAALSQTGPSDTTPRTSDVRHYSHLGYKFNDTGWFDDKRSHIFVVDARTGEAKQITQGDDWNDLDPQWSPDSTRIAFVSDRTGKEFDGGHNKDVWVIAATGGAPTKISDHAFDDTQPRWSPDGTQIAYTGETRRRELPKIYMAPAGGGQSKLAADGLDLIPTALGWVGNELRFETGVKGQNHVFRVDPGTRRVLPVTSGERAVRAAEVRSGKMVYLANDFRHLDDLYVANPDGSSERQLTHLNTKLWADLDLASVERVPYKSTDGWQVDGFLVKPLGGSRARNIPWF